MTAARTVATLVDLAAMAAVALAIWFGWNPLLAYLPGGLAADVDAVAGWVGADAGACSWLGWLGAVEWPVGAVLVAILFWAAERLVARVRRALS